MSLIFVRSHFFLFKVNTIDVKIVDPLVLLLQQRVCFPLHQWVDMQEWPWYCVLLCWVFRARSVHCVGCVWVMWGFLYNVLKKPCSVL
jgi:hypothetical protein